jgi:nicotinamide riboside transporter PnuC
MSLFFQILGTSCGILGALLTVFKKRGCWVAYMVSNTCFVTLFLIEGIYVPILQYMVFASINIAGWVKWGKK